MVRSKTIRGKTPSNWNQRKIPITQRFKSWQNHERSSLIGGLTSSKSSLVSRFERLRSCPGCLPHSLKPLRLSHSPLIGMSICSITMLFVAVRVDTITFRIHQRWTATLANHNGCKSIRPLFGLGYASHVVAVFFTKHIRAALLAKISHSMQPKRAKTDRFANK